MIRYKIKAAAFRIPLMRISQDVKEKLAFSSRDYLQGWRKPIYIPYLADEGINVPWVAHNFWLLVKEEDGQEEEIEAAHAFASQLQVNKDGSTIVRAVPVGRVNDFLMIHFLKRPAQGEKRHWLAADAEDQKVMYGDKPTETDVLQRWKRLKTARPILNSYKVRYSAFGLGWTLGLASPTINSNSGYKTMGMIMEVEMHYFKHWQPGIENTMIPEQDLLDLIQVIKEKEVAK
jgi:hypothetical protein